MDFVEAAIEESADEEEENVESVIVLCFKHGAYAVAGEETVDGMDAVRRGKLDVEAGGGGLFLNDDEGDVEVLKDRDATREKKTSGVGMGGRDEERSALRHSMTASLMCLETPR